MEQLRTTNDKRRNDADKLQEVVFLIRNYGMPYVVKFILFGVIVGSIIGLDDMNECTAKMFSATTFLAGVLIDSWLINTKCLKAKRGSIDVIQFFYMAIIAIGTLLTFYYTNYSQNMPIALECIVNTILVGAVINPVLEFAYNIPREENVSK